MLPREDVSPQQAGQGGREGGAEGAIVDAEGHAVDGGPEGAVADGVGVDAALVVQCHPGLDDAAEEDGGADVRARELVSIISSASSSVLLHFPPNLKPHPSFRWERKWAPLDGRERDSK